MTPGTVAQDVAWLLSIVPIAGILVYIFLGIPVAAILLFFTKLIRSTAYDVDIAQIGNRFSGMRMIRRATVPALFAIAVSGIVMEFIEGLLFTVLQNVPPQAVSLLFFFRPIVGTLITLPIVLVIFIPTWMLNDAGIVMHLKPDQLSIRRCPDSIGVGRWLSNLLSGFTIFTIPFVLFVQQFQPIIGDPATTLPDYVYAIVFSLGIPFLAIAFVIPVVIFNEMAINGSKRAVRSLAKRTGARELSLTTVVKETKIIDEETEYEWGLKTTPKTAESDK